jgi:hypothetical protein
MLVRSKLCCIVAALAAYAAPVLAHPAPFSYLDIRLAGLDVDVTLVAHVFDIAHDLDLAAPERLLEPSTLAAHANAVTALLSGRVRIAVDGTALTGARWSAPVVLADRQSVLIRTRLSLLKPPGALSVSAFMFPYDPVHRTFVNVYERDTLMLQAILTKDRQQADHFAGTRQGTLAVVRKFVAAGIHHILIGPDHLLFLVGLLLLGGSFRRLVLVVSAFTIAHSVTLSLAALSLVSPPAWIVEPAIALSIVYVGADNLTVQRLRPERGANSPSAERSPRDVRVWIAFAFGLIHGFGFASVLREMGLPARALGWSLFSFNLGVEIGQLVVVAVVASAIAAIRKRSEVAGRRLAVAGSIAVILAGAFWFIERVFFPAGVA